MNEDIKKIVNYIDNGKIKSTPRLLIDKKGNIIPISFDFVEYNERTINDLKRNFKSYRTNKIKVFNNLDKNGVIIDLSKLKLERGN